jgi:zinc/manganese transport system substrate-binding protein
MALGLLATPALALEVFATVPEWGALARELGGDDVEVYTATTALQNVHRIQARPSLIAKYRQADLLICTGADLEVGWLPALADKGNNPKLRPGAPGFFEAYRQVTMLEVPQVLDRSLGDVHPFGNPHIQTDARNIALVAAALGARLQEIDPTNAAMYRTRLQDFQQRWQQALARWTVQAAPLNGMAVASQHKAFGYLYNWLGIVEVAVLEPKPGVEPSVAHLQQVLASLKGRPARMVLHAAYQDARPSNWLQQNAGVPTVKLPFTVGGSDRAKDLFGLFDDTLERLLAANSSAK